MSEKLLPRIAAGTALTVGVIAAAHAINSDRVAQPDRGNNPDAVARFDEALHGQITGELPDNPSDMKVVLPTQTQEQQYVPYTTKKGDNFTEIVEEKVAEGYIDPAHAQADIAKMVANNGNSDKIGEGWGLQVPVDRTAVPHDE